MRLGAQVGPFAKPYVVAHEYGHHVQDVVGGLQQSGAPMRRVAGHVRTVELQADCLAGISANHVVRTGAIEDGSQQDINHSLDAAAAVGGSRRKATLHRRRRPTARPSSASIGSALVIKVALNACDASRGHVYRVPQGDLLGPPWTRRLRRTRWPAGWHSAPSARSGLTSTRSAGLSWSSKRLAAGRPCTRRRHNLSGPTHPPESKYARANLVCRTRVSFRQGSSCSRGCISP
jgi:hypothetical protein